MQARRLHNFLAVLLTLSALALGAYAYDRFSTPSGRALPQAAIPPALADERGAAALSEAAPLPPLQSYAAITNRPLFSDTRRPPAPKKIVKPKPVIAAVPAPMKIETGQYAVMGIVIDDDSRSAFLRKGREGEFVKVAPGQELDGWTVDEITPDSVKLRQGEVVDLVRLRDNVLTRAELQRLQKFKRNPPAAKNDRKRQNLGQRMRSPKRLQGPKGAIAPQKPAVGQRARPRRRINLPPRIEK